MFVARIAGPRPGCRTLLALRCLARGLAWVAGIASIAGLLSIGGCSPPTATGTYLAKFTNGLLRLQLVQTGEHSLSGQAIWAYFDLSGKMATTSASVVGAVDAQAINLTFKGHNRFFGETTGAGQLSSGGLKLTGNFDGGLKTISFSRTDEAQYEAVLGDVKSSARTAVENNDRAQLVLNMNAKVVELAKFQTYAVAHMRQWQGAARWFEGITASMNDKFLIKRSLASHPDKGVERAELSIAINEDLISMNQRESELAILISDFTDREVPILNNGQSMLFFCGPKNRDATWEPCQRLTAAVTRAKPVYEAFGTGLAHLKQIYNQQRQRQAVIAAEADRIN